MLFGSSKSPKSELHEFFQLHPGGCIPTFDTRLHSRPPADPVFRCTLTFLAIAPQSLPEKIFLGQARKKKTAEQNAAKQALESLRQRGLIAPAMLQRPGQQLPPDLQKQPSSTHLADSVSIGLVSYYYYYWFYR